MDPGFTLPVSAEAMRELRYVGWATFVTVRTAGMLAGAQAELVARGWLMPSLHPNLLVLTVAGRDVLARERAA